MKAHVQALAASFVAFFSTLWLPIGVLLLLVAGVTLADVRTDHTDAVLVAVGILVGLIALRVGFRDHEAQDAKRHAEVLRQLALAQRYPAQVAAIYGPISHAVEKLKREVEALQRDAHTHDLSVPVRPHQRPPPVTD